MMNDPAALIVRKETWGEYCLLAVHSPGLAGNAAPGQFLMVRVGGGSEPLLRRPFSIHAKDGDRLEIFFSKVGKGTEILAERNPGETLDILGPLGKGFRLPRKKKAGRPAFLVGGGRGIAPLYFLARELRSRGVRPRIFYGGRTDSHLPLLPKLAELGFDLFVSTDDGSLGFHGFICPMLERELARWLNAPRRGGRRAQRPEIFVCGPDAMMTGVAGIADKYRLPAQFSLESIMGCGFGACWGCVRKIRRAGQTGRVKICEEGPVFKNSEIVWEEE
jgi:dihydroorotate dehydrogenase electron transfer subunit